MRRRDALRNCAVLGATGGLAALAGCSGGADGPEADAGESTESAALSREGFDYREGDDGNLVVTVTISNSGSAEGTGYLYVTVTASTPIPETENESEAGNETGGETTGDGDGTVASRKSREVTVPAGETATVEIPFEFTYEQFTRRGGIDVDFRP